MQDKLDKATLDNSDLDAVAGGIQLTKVGGDQGTNPESKKLGRKAVALINVKEKIKSRLLAGKEEQKVLKKIKEKTGLGKL